MPDVTERMVDAAMVQLHGLDWASWHGMYRSSMRAALEAAEATREPVPTPTREEIKGALAVAYNGARPYTHKDSLLAQADYVLSLLAERPPAPAAVAWTRELVVAFHNELALIEGEANSVNAILAAGLKVFGSARVTVPGAPPDFDYEDNAKRWEIAEQRMHAQVQRADKAESELAAARCARCAESVGFSERQTLDRLTDAHNELVIRVARLERQAHHHGTRAPAQEGGTGG